MYTFKHDYYKILNVPFNVDKDEIKKAYLKCAKLYHPDCGGDPEKFKLIHEAYEILSDEKTRYYYDEWYSNANINYDLINKPEYNTEEKTFNYRFEDYIVTASQKYYDYLKKNHLGTVGIEIDKIVARSNNYFSIVTKRKIQDVDGLIVKVNNIILSDKDYKISEYHDYEIGRAHV